MERRSAFMDWKTQPAGHLKTIKSGSRSRTVYKNKLQVDRDPDVKLKLQKYQKKTCVNSCITWVWEKPS